MKSVLRAVLCTLPLILISASLAKTTLQGPPPPPPPPPAADYSPKSWKEYQSESGKFSIKLPGQPKESSTSAESPTGQVTINSWTHGTASFITYTISWWDSPNLTGDAKVIKEALDTLRDKGLATISQVSHKVLKEEDVQVEGYPGKLLFIEVADKMLIRVKWIIVDKRVYAITVQTRKDPPNAMMSENGYEQIAMSYLNSFRLLK
ncbi:MAG TPA: hypothetical protein VEF04_01975 [Blastocatellia bacterium]|nr:hypothetical protein [Blastocatellia bacterium]